MNLCIIFDRSFSDIAYFALPFFFPLGEFFGCGRKMYFFFVKIIYFFVLISKVFQCFNQVKVRVFNAIRNDVVITKRVNISIKCRVEIIEGTEWMRT